MGRKIDIRDGSPEFGAIAPFEADSGKLGQLSLDLGDTERKVGAVLTASRALGREAGAALWQALGLPLIATPADRRRRRCTFHPPLLDHARSFVAENVVSVHGEELAAGELHQRYFDWCRATGREPLTISMIGRLMEPAGLVKHRRRRVIYEARLVPMEGDDDRS